MLISVVLPAYNEGVRIVETLYVIRSTLDGAGIEYELIVVDDGSCDKTSCIVMGLDDVKVVRHDKNRGKGAALRSGLCRADGEIVFFTDADLSYSPVYILQALDIYKNTGVDMVVGRRMGGVRGYSLMRTMASGFYSFLTGVLGLGELDTQCGFKSMTRSVCEVIIDKCVIDGFAFDVEFLYLAKKSGIAIAELPVKAVHSNYSSVNIIYHGTIMTYDILKIMARHMPTHREEH